MTASTTPTSALGGGGKVSLQPPTSPSSPPTSPLFDLRNQVTFNTSIGNQVLLSTLTTSKEEVDGAFKKILDVLQNYRDTIEVQLLNEISLKAPSFFGALKSLQQLEVFTEQCVERIDKLRGSLSLVRETNIKKGLKIIRLKQRRSDLSTLYGAVKLVGQARACQPIIKVLLGQGDYVGALDMLEEASLFLKGQGGGGSPVGGEFHGLGIMRNGESLREEDETSSSGDQLAPGVTLLRNQAIIPQNLDLRGVTSAAHVSSQLSEISKNISSVMEEEFRGVLLKDLQMQLDLIANTPYSTSNVPARTLIGVASTSIRSILSEKYSFATTPSGGGDRSTTTTEEPKLPMPPLSPQDESLKATLTPLVFGLARVDRLNHALNGYKEVLFKQLKLVSKQYYPKMTEAPPNSTKAEVKAHEKMELAKQLKGMSFDLFFGTLVKILIFFLRSLQRAAIVNEIIISIIKEADKAGVKIGASKIAAFEVSSQGGNGGESDKSSPLKINFNDEDDALDSIQHLAFDDDEAVPPPPGELIKKDANTDSQMSLMDLHSYSQITADSASILFAAIELTHTRTAKLVAVRQDQNSHLNPKDFYRLFNALWEFLLAGELLCGRMCFGLKGSVLAQAKSYINFFHEEKTKQTALLLDNEQWIQADIPIDFQHMTEQLQAHAVLASPATAVAGQPPKIRSHPLEAGDDDDEMDMTAMVAAHRASSSSESLDNDNNQVSSKYLVVNGSKYYAVVTVLIFLKSLTDYVQCAKNVPSLTPEILARIFEFLKLFNSRTCQLILGSGALRSAGLQSITAKHIALTSQSLGLIMAVIPHIKAGISQYLNSRQQVLLGDFDRIIGDYRNHQNELYMNLVNIMMDRLHTHASNLVAINWDTPDQKDFGSDGISVTMSSLVKETSTLHKVLCKYLPPESLKSIMNEVFRSYVRRLEDDLKKIDLFSSSGKNRLLADAHHFTEVLSGLDGVDGPGSQLEVCVNNIRIKDKRTYVPPPKAPQNFSSSSSISQQQGQPPKPPPNPAAPSSTSNSNTKFSMSTFGKILRQNEPSN